MSKMAGFTSQVRLSSCAIGLSISMILASAFGVEAAIPKPVASDGTRSLKIVAAPRYVLGVTGNGWSKNSLLTVTARNTSKGQTMKLKATSHGMFRVGVSLLGPCDDFTFTVRDRTHRLTVQRPSRQCPVPAESGPPALTVLQGKQMTAKQLTIDVSKPPATESLRVGDVLYLYDPNTSAPSLVTGDSDHFNPIDHGTVPACPPNTSCALPPGVYWRFTATHTGDGMVIVSPACRQSKPPCMAPDRVVRITILP